MSRRVSFLNNLEMKWTRNDAIRIYFVDVKNVNFLKITVNDPGSFLI